MLNGTTLLCHVLQVLLQTMKDFTQVYYIRSKLQRTKEWIVWVIRQNVQIYTAILHYTKSQYIYIYVCVCVCVCVF